MKNDIFSHNSTEETGWGHVDNRPHPCEIFTSPLKIHCCTITIQRLSKLLNPLHASLFDLLLTEIFTDIEIWVSVLKHQDKFKHIILHFKTMCTPFSTKYLTIYGLPITILEHYVGTTKNVTLRRS